MLIEAHLVQNKDTGCPGGCTSSLNCPRERCIYGDNTEFEKNHLVRVQEVASLRREGFSIQGIARRLELSKRTVDRMIVEARTAR